jgi:stage V sporulation protein G
MKIIKEIEIIPVKPKNGLIAFCSFVIFGAFYVSSVAIMTRPKGGYRLVYPTKKLADRDINLFYPIDKNLGALIQEEVIIKYNDVIKNDRHNSFNNI